MTQTLTFVVWCEGLGLAQPFVESCWGYVMFKCHQYATHDSKVSINLNIISIKETQSISQKTIMWTKKSGKGQQEWHKTCLHNGVPQGCQSWQDTHKLHSSSIQCSSRFVYPIGCVQPFAHI